MQQMALMYPVRRSGRSLADPSPSKGSQVRTMAQHDWSKQPPSNQFHDISDANEYDWRPRETRRAKRGDADRVRTSAVPRRSSRVEPPSRDLAFPSIEANVASASTMLVLAGPPRDSRTRSREHKGERPLRSPRRPRSPSVEHQLRALGAWSDASIVRHKGLPSEFLEDDKQFHAALAMPKSPRQARLPTPELVPLAGDHEFCACCVDAQDEFDESWYTSGRAKMDAQLEDAMAHIATMSAGGRRRLEY
ncbi:LOW QUALITY PROTEIN: hypothetical protein HJFPF1_00237 [Paramyrothecium foliicola]|nr:LOW QUALITY PROTEIN: hypothetical protein HJFPF1_00237 [Paramyrothecium foliicola]